MIYLYGDVDYDLKIEGPGRFKAIPLNGKSFKI